MAKARPTNKANRNLAPSKDEGYPTPPTEPEPFNADEWWAGIDYVDYGEGKTHQQEAEDSMKMLGSALLACIVIVGICVAVFVLFVVVP